LHRLVDPPVHLLNRFDTIVWMADGKVIDMGSLAELLSRQPPFWTLWQNYVGSQSAAPTESGDLVLAA
jgi:ATP-binding cassette, subfamily B, bacterial